MKSKINKYRITKYNPKNRRKNGGYSIVDWTSMSDIGKQFNKIPFGVEEYKKVETNYLKAISLVLAENDVESLTVENLEKNRATGVLSYDGVDLNEGAIINPEIAIDIARDILREKFWALLIDKKNKVKVEFGYDYYMYVTCEKLSDSIVGTIHELGLYVEKYPDELSS